MKISLLRLLVFILMTIFLLTACGGKSSETLEGSKWQLSELGGAALVPDSTITIEFSADQAGGSSGCNSYSGSYQVNGDQISFGPMASTMMACADSAVMDQEQAYLVALGSVKSYKLEGDTLSLFSAENEVLTFKKQP